MISAGQSRWRLNKKTVPTIAAPAQQSHTAQNLPLPFAGMLTMTCAAARPQPDPRSKRRRSAVAYRKDTAVAY